MAALPAHKAEIVRAMVSAAPDHVINSLCQALSDSPMIGPLGEVRALVEAEASERQRRNATLQPVYPLFGGPEVPGRPNFPRQVLRLLWTALAAAEPEAIGVLRKEADEEADAREIFEAQEALCARAAEGLRTRETEAFAAAADACDAELLAACLELSMVVRRALQRLPGWLAHRTPETAAAARLAYKDAVDVAEDATPRFFHMLSAHLDQPWMILRIISAVMDKPNERYLHDSELASFAEVVLEEVDLTLQAAAAFRGSGGPPAAREMARRCALAVQQIMEIEANVELSRESGWGHRLYKQRAALADSIEARMREAEKAVLEALPLQTGRGKRGPRLDAPPAPIKVDSALTLLTFSDALHSAANYGGFAASRNRMTEKVGEHLDLYLEEALQALRSDAEPTLIRDYLDCAADFAQLVRGEKAAELIRRRAQNALGGEAAA